MCVQNFLLGKPEIFGFSPYLGEMHMEIKIYEQIPEAARKIREEVFVREQGFEYEFDDIDKIGRAHV